MPSSVILEKKKQYVSCVVEKFSSAKVWVVVSYKGISVQRDTQLRKDLRECGVEYFVIKNTMLRFVSKQLGFDIDNSLSGSTAVALSKEDPVGICKVLVKCAEELEKDKEGSEFFVKCGFLDGEVVGKEIVKELGSLPTRKELMGMLIGLLVSPIRGFVVGCSEIAKKVSASQEGTQKV